ncbi:MAG: hypothetical protein GY810_22660 [Aureispira sp.]|nr:hypothetical protein [Aureispira sp.]
MQKRSSHIAFFLAILMLISNVGISMDILLCHCTDQLKVAIFSEVEPQTCCKHKLQKEVKTHSCCKKTTKPTHCTKPSIDKKTEKVSKDCCSNGSQYLTLDQAHTQDNLNIDFSNWVAIIPNKLMVAYTATQDWILPNIYNKIPSNKAPPLPSGRQLLQAIQRYIC